MTLQQMISSVTIGEFVGWILAIAAGIVAIAKAIEVIRNHKKEKEPPCDARLRMLDNDKRHIERIDEVLVELKNANNEQARANGVMFRGVLALMNHELSGNDVEILRTARDEMNDFLTKKGA